MGELPLFPAAAPSPIGQSAANTVAGTMAGVADWIGIFAGRLQSNGMVHPETGQRKARTGAQAVISRLLNEADGQRVFALIFETGDEPMSCLTDFARQERITGASITGIGAFSEATLAYFDWDKKEYEEIPVREQVEVASLVGDIGVGGEDKPAIHIHLVLGRRGGQAVAGHLLNASVRPTLELMISESPYDLRRGKDPESGLNLIRF